jgi:antirestriction protein ArdC
MASQQQVRETITAQIIAALESGGVPPWRRPWRVGPNAGSPANVVSKKAYRGINPLLLVLASARHGLTSKWWGTFNQWKNLGGKVMPRPSHVPPGKWGTQIVFWSPVTKTELRADGEESEDRFFVMRTFTVFNVDQVEGGHLDHLRAEDSDTTGSVVIDYQPAEEAIGAASDGMGVGLRYGGGRAFYSPSQDSIQVPPRATFDGPEELYATIFHEFVHATEHPNRLNWSRNDRENTYALGELVAELGSCFIARELGVPASDDMSNHVAYPANWLKAMKDDPRFIFTASSQASRAADFILSYSRSQVAEEIESEAVLAG